MINIDMELDRYLSLLRNKIRERGFTQLEVQGPLGWGRSYISQLLTRQKALRLEQVLLILKVIGVRRPRDVSLEINHRLNPESFPGHMGEILQPDADSIRQMLCPSPLQTRFVPTSSRWP